MHRKQRDPLEIDIMIGEGAVLMKFCLDFVKNASFLDNDEF